jgi:hypothetical protein
VWPFDNKTLVSFDDFKMRSGLELDLMLRPAPGVFLFDQTAADSAL